MLIKLFQPQTFTLPATTETDMLGRTSDYMDVAGLDRAEFGFQNTGSNSVTVKVYYSPAGVNLFPDATTYTVAAGATQRIVLNPLTATRLRITATAAAGGSTGLLEGILVRSSR
jgi:hypothetical protein